MVTIISKGNGPDRKTGEARKLVQENRGTIQAMVDYLGGGAAGRQARSAPPVTDTPDSRALFRRFSASLPAGNDEIKPYLRISVNNRVIIADSNSARQLHFLGELRGKNAVRRFVLATRENGFIAPLEEALREQLADLDNTFVPNDAAIDKLSATLNERLGFSTPDPSPAP